MPDGRTGPADEAPIRERIDRGLEAIFGSGPVPARTGRTRPIG